MQINPPPANLPPQDRALLQARIDNLLTQQTQQLEQVPFPIRDMKAVQKSLVIISSWLGDNQKVHFYKSQYHYFFKEALTTNK